MSKFYCTCGNKYMKKYYYNSHKNVCKTYINSINVIVYPSPTQKLNVNEMYFSKPIKNDNYILVEDLKVHSLDNWYKNLNKPVKSIVILKDNYGKFIENNINFIIDHKEIRFYIYECDLHYLSTKQEAYNRYMLLRSQLINNPHIYILAYYWYHYSKLYKIDKANLLCFPKFVFKENILPLNKTPLRKVLLSGAITKYYPHRTYLKNLNHPNVDILKRNDGINGNDYNKYLNKYICCFTCCSIKTTPYIIAKVFEIPAAGSLLLAFDEYVKEPLKELGFIDGVNYISCNQSNMVEKINYICDEKNSDIIDIIRENGQKLVKERHTDKERYEYINKILFC